MAETNRTVMAIVTAAMSDDSKMMAQLINEMPLGEIGLVIASFAGLTSAFIDQLAANIGCEPEDFLHKMGVISAELDMS